MYRRLKIISSQLDSLGLTHNSHYIHELERLAGSTDIEALKVLADVVEPVKEYTREQTAPYPATSLTPLNRLVDAVSPESDAARTFNAQVDSLLSSPTPATIAELRATLTAWRDNDAALQPLLQSSFLLKQDTALSTTLAQLGATGLQALDYLEHNQPAPADWKQSQLAILEDAKKPKSQLLIMVAPAVQRLVQGKPSTSQ